MFSYYGSLSTEVYDLSKPIGFSFGDVEYYRERLKDCKGKILEPAIGTGRIAIPLLEAGLDIEGFDLSEEMLTLCRKHCAERKLAPKLSLARMETFPSDSLYEAVIVPTGSFLLVADRADSLRALENFYQHLAPDGRLLADLFLPTDFRPGKTSLQIFHNLAGEMITLEERQTEINPIEQITVTYHKYEKWRDKVLIGSELERFPLRWYGIEEFKLVLEHIGFRDIVLSSDYIYGAPPTAKTEIITFEAYK